MVRVAAGLPGGPSHVNMSGVANPPKWPSTVRVFKPSDTDIEAVVGAAFAQNGGHNPPNNGQFSSARFAFLFEPGTYTTDVRRRLRLHVHPEPRLRSRRAPCAAPQHVHADTHKHPRLAMLQIPVGFYTHVVGYVDAAAAGRSRLLTGPRAAGLENRQMIRSLAAIKECLRKRVTTTIVEEVSLD